MENVLVTGIHDIFELACIELFNSLDCDILILSEGEELLQNVPAAVIDAGSEDIEIDLVMRMPHEVLALTYPDILGDITTITDEQLDDWISELANLLIGRVKAKFMRHDCPITIGLPHSYFGGEVDEMNVNENAERFAFRFSIDNEICECALTVEVFSDALNFCVEEHPEADVLEEGTIELF